MPLVESHVIPRSFYEITSFKQKAPKKSLSILSDSEHYKPVKRPIGIYDTKLFCAVCEKKFMVYDDYAFKLLNEQKDNRKTMRDENGQEVVQYYENYDYQKLKIFFMSVLLRASLSEDFFFQNVNVGPFLEALKEAVERNDPKSTDEFSVFLSYYKNIKRSPIIFPPEKKRIDDIKFYFFHIGRVIFYIKADKRKSPSSLRPITIKPGGKLYLLAYDIRDSNVFEILKRMVDNPRNAGYFEPYRDRSDPHRPPLPGE